jgi:hypothetical protein
MVHMIDLLINGRLEDSFFSTCLLTVMHIGFNLGGFVFLLIINIGRLLLRATGLVCNPLDQLGILRLIPSLSALPSLHRNIGNYIRLNQMNELELPDEDPFYGLLNAIALAVRATWHSTLQASPTMQLVFHHQAFLPISYQPDWELIQARKQAKINQSNQKENSSRIPHEYSVGDQVLVEQVVKTNKFARDTSTWAHSKFWRYLAMVHLN